MANFVLSVALAASFVLVLKATSNRQPCTAQPFPTHNSESPAVDMVVVTIEHRQTVHNPSIYMSEPQEERKPAKNIKLVNGKTIKFSLYL